MRVRWRVGRRVVGKERIQVRFDKEAGTIRGIGGIGLDFGRVGVQLRAPDQAGLLALCEDGIEEPAKGLDAVALADLGERGMIGQWFVEVIADIPASTQTVGDNRISWRSEWRRSKKSTSWSLKKTTGSMEGRPPAA